MKRNQLLLVFLLLAWGVNAQNWNFIKPNERYHFQHVDDDIPLNTIFADSTALVGTDSVLYLNRLFLPCDTCELHVEFGDSLVPYYDNQPGFLQREIIFSQVSSTVVMSDPEQSIIKLPNLGIKEWWFNKEKNQKATLDTIVYGDVLGVQDSIATISIDGEPKIKIAKEYGLIQYFDYSLSGLENAELGETLPTWKDFYDFEVGDVMCYGQLYWSDVPPLTDTIILKKVVKSISKNDDEIVIDWEVKKKQWFLDFGGDPDFEEFDENQVISKHGIANTYPHKFVDELSLLPEFTQSDESISLQYSSYGSDQGLNKFYNKVQGEDYYVARVSQYGVMFNMFNIKLGQTILEDSYEFAYTEEVQLVGYVKNGTDTTGVVYGDDFFVPVDTTSINESILQNLKIAPNPSRGQLSFELGNYQQAQVKVYTLQGKQVEGFVVEQNENKDLHYLNSGIYLITIEVPEGMKQIKWVKQ